MEVKKNPKYNLEKKRILFLQFGFLISFLFVLMAFEYKVPIEEPEVINFTDLADVEDVIMVTFTEPEKLEAPKVKKIELIDLIIIDDDPEVDDYDPVDSFGNLEDEVIYNPVTVDDEVIDETTPFVMVKEMPIFNPKKNTTYQEGCKDLFLTMQRMVRYPIVAQESSIQGRVYVRFVVTKTGEISNVEVTRKVDPLLDEEVVRVVRNLPKFKPGRQQNKNVAVWFSGYVNFVLQ